MTTHFEDSFSEEVWASTYKDHKDENVASTLRRVAKAVASVENTKDLRDEWEDTFYKMLSNFNVTVGGRIYSNAGTEWGGTTLMNCFTPDAEVLTITGPKLICDVEIGDFVLTHRGRYQKVVNTMTREYHGQVQRFRSSYFTNDIVSTPEHPYYQGNQQWVNSEDVTEVVLPFSSNADAEITLDLVDILHDKFSQNLIEVHESKINTRKEYIGGNGAKGTKKGHSVQRYVTVDSKFAYLLGRFVGDGCTFKNNNNSLFEVDTFNIAFNASTENKHAQILCSYFEQSFGITPNFINSQNNTLYLRKASQIVAETLRRLVGDGFATKRIPSVIWESNKDIQVSFLKGLYDADGFVTKSGDLQIEITNDLLVAEIQTLTTLVGIPSSRSNNRLFAGSSVSAEFRSGLWKHYEDPRLYFEPSKKPSTGPRPITGEGFVVTPERFDENYSGFVYNISVEEDESYVVNNVVVHNCFVGPRPSQDLDSLDGILGNLRNQSQTLKSEGGWGENFSYIRPRGSFIHGIGVETPGAIKYMELFDKSSEIITAGSGKKSTHAKAKGKIRKGAMMGVLDVWHPDIVEFITAKQQAGRLSKFNMSVNCTDEFMSKVIEMLRLQDEGICKPEELEEADKWDLRFPDTTFEKYDDEWYGDLKAWEEKGYPVIVHETISVVGLWELIMKSTYNRAEPGVLFLDRANYYNPGNYFETIMATNPSMPAGTLVHTINGIFPIEQLENKEFLVKSLDGAWADAKCVMSSESAEVLEISLGGHKTVQSTPEHRWPVYDTRMKRIYKAYASDLKPGDMIPLNRNEAIGIYGDETLTQEEGFLVGYLIGDGWFVKKHNHLPNNHEYNIGFTFGIHEEQMAEKIKGILNSLKLNESNVKRKNNELYIQTSSQEIVDLFLNRYKLIPGTKDVPQSVWQGNDNFVKGFVDGLLSADGCVVQSDTTNRISLTTSRKALAINFAKLLSFAGINTNTWTRTSSSFPNGKEYDRSYERWDVSIDGRSIINFYNVFDITHPDKKEKLEEVASFIAENVRKNNVEQFVKVQKVAAIGKAKVWDISVKHNQHVFPAEWCYTGNCGEQTLSPGNICCLGSINLTQFINKAGTGFNLTKLAKHTRWLVRFLDNVNSLSNAPLPEYEEAMRTKRRIGCGVLGWGSALYMLKTRYGSDQAEDLRNQVMSTIAKNAYMASIDLAEEKGKFELCEPAKHAESPFVKKLGLSNDYMDKLRSVGIRNSCLLSLQPTGNTSIFANIASGGCEPVFMPEYIRTVIVNSMPDHIKDICPKWYEGEFEETEMFKFHKEGDETILRGTDEFGTVYKIDKNRGLTKEVLCEDYGVRNMKAKGDWDETADWAATTTNLSVDDHIRELKGFANYVDSAISKCVAKGTLISTDKGIKKIEDMGEHDREGFNPTNETYRVLDENGEQKTVTSHYYGGNKPCKTIRFDNGFELTAALTHKLKTAGGWISCDDLLVGDKVFYRTNELIIKNDYIELPQPNFSRNIQRQFPKVLDENFALFLGMWMADGCTNQNSVVINEKNSNVERLVRSLFAELFGDVKSSIDDRWGVRAHQINSRALASYFKQYFGTNAADKTIPQMLLDSPKSVWLAFLSGLTLDGYLKQDQYRTDLVIYDGYSKDVAHKVSYMLSTMGIEYHLAERSVPNGVLSDTTYGVKAYLTDIDTIVPVEEHKQNYSSIGKTQSQTFVANEALLSLIDRQPRNTYGSIMRARLKKCMNRGNFVRMSFLDKLNFDYDQNLTVVKIVDISDTFNEEVYDIEVEDTHSYLINGIVSHNTINLPFEFSFDDFQDLYLDAYKTGYIKGLTTYRAGTMTSVLSSKENVDSNGEEIILDDVKLPDSSPAVIKVLRAESRKWYLTVVYHEDNDRPFALFVKTNAAEKNVVADEAVELLMKLATKKKIPKRHRDDVWNKIGADSNSSKVTRVVSFLLRHGVLIKNIVAVLDQVESAYVGTFVFQMKKFLSTYIKDGEKVEDEKCQECGSNSVVFSEGCKKCTNCGSSKCG